MPMFHVVLHRSGPDYRPELPLEQQTGWDEHAAFMDRLVADGFLVLGGPWSDEHRVVHAVEAVSEQAVRETLARDPWAGTHLEVASVDLWTGYVRPPFDSQTLVPDHAAGLTLRGR